MDTLTAAATAATIATMNAAAVMIVAATTVLELSKTGMYVTYPYLESHESREPVPR